jgi:hypothetical protein
MVNLRFGREIQRDVHFHNFINHLLSSGVLSPCCRPCTRLQSISSFCFPNSVQAVAARLWPVLYMIWRLLGFCALAISVSFSCVLSTELSCFAFCTIVAGKVVLQTDPGLLQGTHPDIFYILHNKPVMKAALDRSVELLFESNKQSLGFHETDSETVSFNV